jgi:hypothetical protein
MVYSYINKPTVTVNLFEYVSKGVEISIKSLGTSIMLRGRIYGFQMVLFCFLHFLSFLSLPSFLKNELTPRAEVDQNWF